MIIKTDIKNNKLYQLSGENSNEKIEVIRDWIIKNIEDRKEKSLLEQIIVVLISAFSINEKSSFEFILGKKHRAYYIYFSTYLSARIARFLEKYTFRHNAKNIDDHRNAFSNIIKNPKMSDKTTLAKWIIWQYIEIGVKVKEQVQYDFININSEIAKVEYIISIKRS